MRRIALVFLALTLVTAACSKKEPTATQGRQTFEVSLGFKADAFNISPTAFFPNDLSVHAGDTVEFDYTHFDGEPHTVTAGTLVDAAVAKLAQLGPTASLAAQENSPELLKLVDVFPHAATKAKGPPSPNGPAVAPCFVDSGDPPGTGAGVTTPAWLVGGVPKCPTREQPQLTGTQSFYNLGLFNEQGQTGKITFASSVKAGTYSLMCMVHRGGMTAKVNVLPADQKVQTPSEVSARGKQQFDELVAKLTPVAQQIKSATPDKAVAGAAAQGVFNAIVAEFAPAEIKIKAGSTVRWNVFAFHSLTFNASEEAVSAFVKGPDGSWQFNPKGAPAGGPPPPVSIADFPPAATAPVTYNGGSWNGQGFHNTGIFGSLPPALVTYTLQFTKAGTYPLRCQVHPDMKGKVIVT